jgi:hypothetical protein
MHIWTNLSSTSFILTHPHLPKLHIFRKPTIDKNFLVNGTGFGSPWGIWDDLNHPIAIIKLGVHLLNSKGHQ